MKPSQALRSSYRGRSSRALLAAVLSGALALPPSAAALTHELLFSATGDPGTRMGITLSGVGDLNADGFPDVVAGATGNGSTIPRVYVFFGGPAADGIADLVMAPGLGLEFGQSVTSAADLNGDGYADLAVGSFHQVPGLEQCGRVYIYFGGQGLDTIPDLIPHGEFHFDNFGRSVSAGGDVNGDGYADLIVGAVYAGTVGRGRAGRAYVLWGGPSLDPIPDLTFLGEADGDWFGDSVADAGDVNGDGYHDVLVGAQLHDGEGLNSGRAYLYYGGPGADAEPDRVFDGEAAGDLFGHRVAGAGDVNGDGYDDFLVSAVQHDGSAVDDGRVYLYFGGRQPNRHPDLVIDGESAGDILGRGAPAGDVNADGYADIVVGSPWNDAGGTNAGRVYVLLGGRHPNATPDLVITGGVADGWLGRGVAAGDMNGDGYDDLVYSAFADPTGGSQAGRVFVSLLRPEIVVYPDGEKPRSPAAPLPAIRIWPSPARPGEVLRISFASPLTQAGALDDLDVGVYDLAGRRIATLERGSLDAAGAVQFEWATPRGRQASGLYLVRAASRKTGFLAVRKLALVK